MSRAFLSLVILMTLPFFSGCASYYHPALTQIRADLPVGTPLPVVVTYLDQHEIEHTYFRRSGQIMARIHNVRGDALVQEDLSLIFSFDEYRNLRDLLAKPASSAP